MKYSFSILVLMLIFLTSCKKEGCTDSSAANYDAKAKKDNGSCEYLGCTDTKATNYSSKANKDDGSCVYQQEQPTGVIKLAFNHLVDDLPFELNKTYTLKDGKTIEFELAQFYLSKPVIYGNGTSKTKVFDVYKLVNATKKEYLIEGVELGTYTGFQFGFGVDSTTNNTKQPKDFNEGDELYFQSPNMHWGWQLKYIYIKLEGKIDSNGDGTPDLPFAYHIGNNKYYRLFQYTNELTVVEKETTELKVDVDYAKFFTDVDVQATPTAHNTNATSDAIMKNLEKVFNK